MALLEQKILLKVATAGFEPKIYMVQADSGRAVRCTITDWTIPDGATAVVYVKKPSAKIVYNSCEVDTDTNSVLVTITNQMIAESGLSAAMVEISLNGSVVTAFRFGIIVKSKISGGTESTNESTVLESMLAELASSVTASINNANAAADTANSAADTANNAADTANAAAEKASDATKAANTAEEARAEAEALRVSAEAARVEAEAARVEAENARVEAEAARVAAETAREEASAKAVTDAENATDTVLASVNLITFSINEDDLGLDVTVNN